MTIRWCTRGLRSLREIMTFLAADDVAEARRTLARIEDGLRTIEADAVAGEPSGYPGVQELPVADTQYNIYYRSKADEVHILEIFHAARRRPQHW